MHRPFTLALSLTFASSMARAEQPPEPPVVTEEAAQTEQPQPEKPKGPPSPAATARQARVIARSRGGMGTRLQILVWSDDEAKAEAGIDAAFAELDRVETLMSEWLPDSEISRINKAAGSPEGIVVSAETFEVLLRGKEISEASEGAFSLSWAALASLWQFDSETGVIPDVAKARSRAALVDDSLVQIDRVTRAVRLDHAEMAIGLGGIAKGYSLDRALAVLEEKGLADALVFAGGDIAAMGSKGDRPWLVGIQDPRASGYFATLAIENEAVVSSGDYEKYFEADGRRYHHILDRRTGFPAVGTRSVTVVTQDGLSGDAYATAVFVLGPEKGMAFVEAQAGVEAIIITADNTITLSSGLKNRVRILREPSK